MAYVLPQSGQAGPNNEADGFEKAIASFALMAVHESSGLVNMTSVVTPTQGDTFVIPIFAPITYQDYVPSGSGGSTGYGNANVQNPSLGQASITATPAVATTNYDIFYDATTAFNLAAALGQEIGESFAEKVDQRVAAAFTGFKATVGNALYSPTPADGFSRPTQLGAMELVKAGGTPAVTTAGFTATSVLQLIRNVKTNWKASRLPGNPVVVLDVQLSMSRLLGELTGGAVSQTGGSNLSDLGNELLRTGMIENMYGVMVMFTTFLTTATRNVAGEGSPSSSCYIGAYFSDQAIYTVLKRGLEIRTGSMPSGLQNYLTGVGFFGSGVGDLRRGGAINIEIA